MTSQLDSYESAMQDGNDMLRYGKLTDAKIGFQRATSATDDKHQRASAFQMLVIVYGMLYMYDETKQSAWTAMELVDDDLVFSARIARDAGMALLRIAYKHHTRKYGPIFAQQRDEAMGFLTSSRDSLANTDERIESAVTLGFIGRAALLRGYRQQGRIQMEQADVILKDGDNRRYELNNLMWLIRTVKRRERKALRRRILRLIAQTEDFRRYDQLQLIMIGGNGLYEYVENHQWVRKLITRLRGK